MKRFVVTPKGEDGAEFAANLSYLARVDRRRPTASGECLLDYIWDVVSSTLLVAAHFAKAYSLDDPTATTTVYAADTLIKRRRLSAFVGV